MSEVLGGLLLLTWAVSGYRVGIDPGRIGAWGSSAAGDLVSLLGVVGPQAGLDRGPYADQPSNVQAVVDMFGAADLTDLHDSERFLRATVELALGGSTRVRRGASPGSYLGAGANAWARAGVIPPFLILHGTNDQGHPPAALAGVRPAARGSRGTGAAGAGPRRRPQAEHPVTAAHPRPGRQDGHRLLHRLAGERLRPMTATRSSAGA